MTVRFPRSATTLGYAALPAPVGAMPVPAGSGPGILLSLGVNAVLAMIFFEARRSARQDAQRFSEMAPPLRFPAPVFNPSSQDQIDLLEQEIARLRRSSDPLDQDRARILSGVVESLQLEITSLQSPALQSPNVRNPRTIVNSAPSPAATPTSIDPLPLSSDETREMESYLHGSQKHSLPISFKELMDYMRTPPRIQLRAIRLMYQFEQGADYVLKILMHLHLWSRRDAAGVIDIIPAFNAAIEVAPQLLKADPPPNSIVELFETIDTILMPPYQKLLTFVFLLRGLKDSDPWTWKKLTMALIQFARPWHGDMKLPIFHILSWGPEATVPALTLIQHLQGRGVGPHALQALIGTLGDDLPYHHLVETLVTLDAFTRLDNFTTPLDDHVRLWEKVITYYSHQAVHYFRQIRTALEHWGSSDAFPLASELWNHICTFGGYSRNVDAQHRVNPRDIVSGVAMPGEMDPHIAVLAHAALSFWPEDYTSDLYDLGAKQLSGMRAMVVNLATAGDRRSDVPESWQEPINAVIPPAPTATLRDRKLLDPLGDVAHLISLLKKPLLRGPGRCDASTCDDLRPDIYAEMAGRPENQRRIGRLTDRVNPASLGILRDILLNTLNAEQRPRVALSPAPTALTPVADLAALSEADQMAARQLIQIIRTYDPSVVQAWMQMPDDRLKARLYIAVEQTHLLPPTASGFALRPWFTPVLFQNPELLAVVRSHFQTPTFQSPEPESPPPARPQARLIAEVDMQRINWELAKFFTEFHRKTVSITYRAVKSPSIGLIVRMMPDDISLRAFQNLWPNPNFIPIIATHAETSHVVQVLPGVIENWDGVERFVVLYMGAPRLVAQTADMAAWFDVTVKYLQQIANAKGMAGVYLMEGAYSKDFGEVLERRQYPLTSERKIPNLYDTISKPRRLITLWEK